MAEFCMPSLGADMKKGILVEWRVEPGDSVKRGDIIAEVETEKAAIEIEVFEDGIVDKLLVEEGEEVPVGMVMAIIRTEKNSVVESKADTDQLVLASRGDESLEPQGASADKSTTSIAEQPEGKPKAATLPESGDKKRFRASPAARKKAAKLGINLADVPGTGRDGTITLADLEMTAAVGKPADKAAAWPIPPALEETKFQLGMRRAIATAMTLSNREIPHYYLVARIDLSSALRWLTEENQKRPVKDRLLPAVLLLKATALALVDVPALNGYWLEDQYQSAEAVHIGFAIALRQGGLIAPAIHHANRKSLDDLMADMKDLINRTRAGGLRSSEMTDATITLTNLGDLGVESAFGLIYPPQVALVSFGRIMDQPWAVHGAIGIRPIVSATLAGDHRATDGRTGAQFLNALNRYLQEAEKL